jgi:hypothetical protein
VLIEINIGWGLVMSIKVDNGWLIKKKKKWDAVEEKDKVEEKVASRKRRRRRKKALRLKKETRNPRERGKDALQEVQGICK